ncbi:MAG: sugar phosphorylase [Terrimicrobiaceae bacterium]
MNATVKDHLAFLYGESAADGLCETVEILIGKAREAGRPAGLPGERELTEADCMLITYGDQVRAVNEPPLETLAGFLSTRAAGAISAVHILPFYPSSSDDGFSVMDYYAVDPDLGTWGDVEKLGQRFELMFDAVFNHASARGVWFGKFLRQEPGWETAFFTVSGDPDLSQVVRPRALPLLTEFETAAGTKRVWTTFSADQADINFSDPRMLLRILETLLFYVSKGARYIRLDAIAFLWKTPGTSCLHLEQTHRAIQLMRTVLNEVAPDVQLITETNVPHADNISYFGDGSNEAQLVYNFALPPLVFHTLRTAEASRLRRWAQTLELPSDRVTFFNFLASHDGIGMNPARGILDQGEIDALVQTALDHNGFVSYKNNPDGTKSPYELNISYFDALSNPLGGESEDTQIARFLAAHSIMLALRGLPGIYFHSLFGSRGDRRGAEESGIPRRINRKKLDFSELQAELDVKESFRARVFAGLRGLIEARVSHPGFSPFAGQVIPEAPPGLFAAVRSASDGRKVLCITNVTAAPITYSLPASEGSEWKPFAEFPITAYNGKDVRLPGYGVSWFAAA